jgi:hypothetical protein
MEKRMAPLPKIAVNVTQDQMSEAILYALRAIAHGHFNTAILGWSLAPERKDVDEIPPGVVRRGLLTLGYKSVTALLPTESPFREALEKLAAAEINDIKD